MFPRWVLVLLAITEGCQWGCAGSPVTPLDQTQMTSETIEDTQCVTANRGDAGAISSCRAGVKRAWDAYWNARFSDGGGVTP